MAKELETHNDPLVFEFDDEAARSQYAALPEFLQTAIARSPEYQEKFGTLSLGAGEAVRQAQAVHRWPTPRRAAAGRRHSVLNRRLTRCWLESVRRLTFDGDDPASRPPMIRPGSAG
jgi:hypothetical protein